MAEVKKAKLEQIKVTLIRSYAHSLENHKRIIQALGLKKIGEFKIHSNIASIQGMIHKVKHLVNVEKI